MDFAESELASLKATPSRRERSPSHELLVVPSQSSSIDGRNVRLQLYWKAVVSSTLFLLSLVVVLVVLVELFSRSALTESEADLAPSFYSFPTNLYPNAKCNDGSMSGFYYSPPPAGSTNDSVWVVSLPGGAQCWDSESCSQRWQSSPGLMSSANAPASVHFGGALSSQSEENPLLWGAHKASLLYCSSDGYMGNVGATKASFNWHFRGQSTVRAMFQELARRFPSWAHASLVVFAGQSAGARGVMANIDALVA